MFVALVSIPPKVSKICLPWSLSEITTNDITQWTPEDIEGPFTFNLKPVGKAIQYKTVQCLQVEVGGGGKSLTVNFCPKKASLTFIPT